LTAQELLDKVHKVFEDIPEHVSATVGDLKKAFAALLAEDAPPPQEAPVPEQAPADPAPPAPAPVDEPPPPVEATGDQPPPEQPPEQTEQTQAEGQSGS
jgi:hypothetical protein